MPYYDLRCPECDKEYKLSATMSEKANKQIACPDCGSTELVTLFKTPPAFIKAQAPCPNATTCGAVCRHAG